MSWGVVMSRSAWLDVGWRVLTGEVEHLRCPENDDDFLHVVWIPGPMSGSGEFHLCCPSCRAETYIRVSR